MEQIKLLPLIKLCEPIFTCICELRCSTNSPSKNVTYEITRDTLNDLLNAVEADLQYASPLWRKYRRIEVALLCFIDFMICESKLPFIKEWDRKRLAYSKGEMAGDYEFFEILKEINKEFSLDAEECLSLLYYCLQLGFTGIYKHHPDEISKIKIMLEDRLPHLKKLRKGNYLNFVFKNIDSRNIMPKRWLNVKRVLMISFVLCVLYFLYNNLLYYIATASLLDIFANILNQ
jgi:type IV/VI secretion system ImpK/VasF family protein